MLKQVHCVRAALRPIGQGQTLSFLFKNTHVVCTRLAYRRRGVRLRTARRLRVGGSRSAPLLLLDERRDALARRTSSLTAATSAANAADDSAYAQFEAFYAGALAEAAAVERFASASSASTLAALHTRVPLFSDS